MAENKERWPGAGLWLDFKNITDEDFDKVEQRLNEIDGLRSQIVFLKKLLRTYEYEIKDVFVEFRKQHREQVDQYIFRSEGDGELKKAPWDDLAKRLETFEQRLREKLKYLTDMFEIELEAQPADSEAIETDLLSEKGADEQVSESGMPPDKSASDKRGKPAFSAAQSCLVIHYLIHAARELEKIEKERRDEGRRSSGVKETDEMIASEEKTREQAFERLLVAMTGWGEDAIRKGRGKMFKRKKQTSEDLRLLKPHFQSLRLSDIAKLIETAAKGEYDDDDDEF